MDKQLEVGVYGSGAWGTTVAKLLVEKGCAVQLWCHEEEVARGINERHLNTRHLMGVRLPPTLQAETDPVHVTRGKDFLLVAIPSPFLLDTVRQFIACPEVQEGSVPIGILSKGFIETPRGVRLITEAMEDYLPGSYKDNLVYIAGPSHAEEVARGKITGLISASRNGAAAIRFRELLAGERLLVFSSLDVRGVQISAAVKNVVAIAFGVLEALSEFSDQFGDNTESLLLAAGLNEIQRLGIAMGASHPETFTSIAGVGDLEVTCRSKFGRNRRFGREVVLDHLLERFSDIESVIGGMPGIGYFAEGVVTARHVETLARQHRLGLPICHGVYRILNREVEPTEAVESILREMP